MSAVTYGESYVATSGAAVAPRKTGWFARAFDRLIEARMQQARAEVERHLSFLPYSFDRQGDRLVKTGHKDMPFGL